MRAARKEEYIQLFSGSLLFPNCRYLFLSFFPPSSLLLGLLRIYAHTQDIEAYIKIIKKKKKEKDVFKVSLAFC